MLNFSSRSRSRSRGMIVLFFAFLMQTGLANESAPATTANGELKGLPLPWTRRAPTTKVSHVKSWKSLSHRFAAGLDEDDNVLAITDLGMENQKSGSFIRRSLLGSIGVGDFHLKGLFSFMRSVIQEEKMLDPDGEKNLLPEDVQKSLGVTTRDQALAKIEGWEKDHGEKNAGLPKNWYTKIKWKTNFPKSNLSPDGSPAQFKLSDIDIVNMSKSPRLLRKTLAKFNAEWKKEFQIETDKNVLEHFEFTKRNDNVYDVFFVYEAPATLKAVSRYSPVFVADVRYPYPTPWKPLGLVLIETALDQIINMAIPNPVLSAIVRYPLKRWFDLNDLWWTSHRLMVLQGLNMAYQGDEESPFYPLTETERGRAAVNILRHNSSILNKFYRKPGLNKWHSGMRKELAKAEFNHTVLDNQNFNVDMMGPLFAMGTRGESKKLFILADSYLFVKKPLVAINYNNLQATRIKRNMAEGFEFVLRMVDLPIPFIATGIRAAYSYFVLDPIEEAKQWEARLSAYLDFRQENKGEDWESEIRYLYSVRLNPFELNRAEELDMIKVRRRDLDLGDSKLKITAPVANL